MRRLWQSWMRRLPNRATICLEEVRKRLRFLTRRIVFRPAAERDLARCDRIVKTRIGAALLRYAVTGYGDVSLSKTVQVYSVCE
jgi:hypothetical protein